MRRFEVFLFPVGDLKLTYEETVDYILGLGYDPFQGRKLIYHLFELWKANEITFPDGQGYIVGLARKEMLQVEEVKGGGKLYSYPIIFRSLLGSGRLTESQFSESDAVNDFSTTYIICTKGKTE